jgi:hypothetical protein
MSVFQKPRNQNKVGFVWRCAVRKSWKAGAFWSKFTGRDRFCKLWFFAKMRSGRIVQIPPLDRWQFFGGAHL